MTIAASTVLCGRYRLTEPLGRGGMAEVWSAWDERLDRPVAVKVIRGDLAHSADIADRLRREAKAAASLEHPGIVRVYDADEVDGIPFLVMEHLPGETLADRYSAGPVDTAWLTDVARDVASALGAAHGAGIVHRDIKPGNIMIAADNRARLADFGIAISLEVTGDPTSSGLVLGTPAYLAPERIQGAPATPAGDVYGLGVVLYEGFAGRRPFVGSNPLAIAHSAMHDEATPLSSLRPDLTPALSEAIDRAIHRDPAARFADGAIFSAAMLGAPVEADATTAIPVMATVSTPTDTQMLTVAPGAVPAALAAGGVAGGVAAAGATAMSWLTDRTHHRVGRWAALAGAALLLVVAVAGLGLLGSAGSDDTARVETSVTTVTTAPPPPTTEPPAVEPAGKGKGRDKHDDD